MSPPTDRPRPPWLRLLAPGALLAFALLLRLAGLDKSLWIDEAGAYVQATAPAFLHQARADVHPPLYFALLRAGTHVTDSFAALRLFSVACGLATVAACLAWPTSRGKISLWIAALWITATPGFITHAQELRPYALFSAALIAALGFACTALTGPATRRTFVGLAAALTVMAATHLLTAFFLVALAGVGFATLRHAEKSRQLRFAAALLPAAAATLWFKYFYLRAVAPVADDWWIPAVDGPLLRQVFGEISGRQALVEVSKSADRFLSGAGVIFLLLAAGGIAFILWTARPHRPNGAARPLLALAFAYWAALVLYSITVTPLVIPRTLLPGMIPLLLGLSLGVAAQPRPALRAAAIATAAALALAMTIPWLHRRAYLPSEDLRGLSQRLHAHAQPDTRLIFVNGVELAVLPYRPHLVDHARLLTLRAPETSPLPSPGDLLTDPAIRHVLLVYRDDLYHQKNPRPLEAFIAALARQTSLPTEIWNRDRYHVLDFSLSPPPKSP